MIYNNDFISTDNYFKQFKNFYYAQAAVKVIVAGGCFLKQYRLYLYLVLFLLL